MKDSRIYLLGIKPDLKCLPPYVNELINKSDVLAGSHRLLDLFPEYKGEKIQFSLPLDQWLSQLEKIRLQGRNISILCSGDPGHFGLGAALLKVIKKENVTIIPSPTIIQQAFAEIGRPWAGVEVVSLHGRDGFNKLWGALFRVSHEPGLGSLAVYTDPEKTPNNIAKRLIDRGQELFWQMRVFENLGQSDEHISACSLFEGQKKKFSPLNLLLLEKIKDPNPIFLGMPEKAFKHEAGLITKSEVRAASISALELLSSHTLWDLGAGSGSISIEAASILRHGEIWAVEKSPRRSEQIAANRSFYGASQIDIIEDDALEAMGHLPSPDRVFIGGGGKDLPIIIKQASIRLNDGGLIVANAVSLAALNSAASSMQEAGLELNISQIQAARSSPLGDSLYFKPLNHVWIIKGRKR